MNLVQTYPSHQSLSLRPLIKVLEQLVAPANDREALIAKIKGAQVSQYADLGLLLQLPAGIPLRYQSSLRNVRILNLTPYLGREDVHRILFFTSHEFGFNAIEADWIPGDTPHFEDFGHLKESLRLNRAVHLGISHRRYLSMLLMECDQHFNQWLAGYVRTESGQPSVRLSTITADVLEAKRSFVQAELGRLYARSS